MDFPRTLYKSGGSKKWGKGIAYSECIVKDETEYNSAIKAGYLNDFNEALTTKVVEDDEPLTKNEVMDKLNELDVEYNPRDKKAVLEELLNIALDEALEK